jgi:hypothetical protein
MRHGLKEIKVDRAGRGLRPIASFGPGCAEVRILQSPCRYDGESADDGHDDFHQPFSTYRTLTSARS